MYNGGVLEIRRTNAFDRWLRGLRDRQAQTRIIDRIDRLAEGNPGDVRPVGEGVSELRFHYGPGYRVYFVQRGSSLVILLAGGDKSSQRRDVARAIEISRALQEAHEWDR